MDSLADMYTPMAAALTTAFSRVGLPALLRGDELAQRLCARPHAVLFRHVATPNFEQRMFQKTAAAAGLIPLILEYHHDKFVTRNLDKIALARMGFFDGLGRNGGPRVRLARIADLTEIDGLRLDQATTHWGQGLIDFHHELLAEDSALADIQRVEASGWFADHGGTSSTYYVDLMAMFTGCSILFDTYWPMGEEGEFTQRIIAPAFARAARLGRRPLVCRTYPPWLDGDPNWARYPAELEPFVRAKLEPARGCRQAAVGRQAA